VFVREAAGHSGSLTRLLPDARALSRALRSLRVRGLRLEDLLVVEFCDLAWEDGLYRKASAYKIGNAIVPAQLVRGQAWSLKWHEGEWNQPALRDLVDYVTDNPHQDWLRRVFELAGVDYGRCDYGIRGDTLQVWEINFNPTVGYRTWPPEPLPPLLNPLMENFRSVHYSALENAFHAVDGSGPRERVKIRLDPDLISRVTRVSTGMRRRGKALQFLHAVYERPRIGRPLRFLLRRFFPPG
jgi:hypothetical protein